MSRYIDREELFNRLSAVKTLAEAYAVVQDMPAAETKNVPDTNVGDMISRQAAIDALMPIYKSASLRNRNVFSTARKCLATIEELPSAERHGRWIDVEHAPHNLFYATCSVCGVRQTLEVKNYCPNCGSRMVDEG